MKHPFASVTLICCSTMLGCCQPRSSEPASQPAMKVSPAAAVQEIPMSETSPRPNSSLPSTTQPRVPADAEGEHEFTGILRGRVMAIGAETTGWRLERDDGTRIDVNVSKVAGDLAPLDGKHVVIRGTIVTANWVERGRRKLIMAQRIDPQPPAAEK